METGAKVTSTTPPSSGELSGVLIETRKLNLTKITRKVLPQRWNEVVGLQHCKVYIFDDSVIISGANLSSDYFTDRWLNLIMFLFLLQSPHIMWQARQICSGGKLPRACRLL